MTYKEFKETYTNTFRLFMGEPVHSRHSVRLSDVLGWLEEDHPDMFERMMEESRQHAIDAGKPTRWSVI